MTRRPSARRSSSHRPSSAGRRLGRIAGTAVATAAAASGLLAAGAQAAHAQPAHTQPAHTQSASTAYAFTTLDNENDPTFNQLLGINTAQEISGYFGSGATGHPNQGYTIMPPYGQANYSSENFPGSVQTQVTGLNNKGDTVGFWANSAGTQRGFVEWNGAFTSYADPHTPKTAGSVNQLLGINDAGIAVGFYVDANEVAHPIKLNQATGHFTTITHAGIGANSFATGINDKGDIVGYTMGSTTYGWLLKDGHLTTFEFPGSLPTMALGLNGKDEVVGSFTDAAGNTHGFTLVDPTGPASVWRQIDDPNALNTPGNGTTVNGLNNAGDLVGFYTDNAGNVNGMLATP
jgi:uncharacterized membrane protein